MYHIRPLQQRYSGPGARRKEKAPPRPGEDGADGDTQNTPGGTEAFFTAMEDWCYRVTLIVSLCSACGAETVTRPPVMETE